MIIISEAENLMWFLVGLVILASGSAIVLTLSSKSFYMLAIGLPLVLVGISVTLMKLHEIILVVVRPERLMNLCKFCNSQNA